MSPVQVNQFGGVPPDYDLPPGRQDAIRTLLEQTVAGTPGACPVPASRPRRALWSFLVTAAAAIAAIAVVSVPAGLLPGDDELVHAATPPILPHELGVGDDPEEALAAISAKAKTDPATAGERPAGVHRLLSESWWLSVSVDGEGAAQHVMTAVVPVRRERTLYADGSVRIHEIHGEPSFPDDEYRRAWDEAGQPDPTGAVLVDETFPPGQVPTAHLEPLAADPGTLRRQLLATSPQADDPAAALFTAIQEVHGEQVITPGVQAAIVSVLAGERGVVSLGTTTDRAGRTVLAVATDSRDSGLSTRYVLLLDPDDGRVLGYEEILTGDTGSLDLNSPAVVAYTTFL